MFHSAIGTSKHAAGIARADAALRKPAAEELRVAGRGDLDEAERVSSRRGSFGGSRAEQDLLVAEPVGRPIGRLDAVSAGGSIVDRRSKLGTGSSRSTARRRHRTQDRQVRLAALMSGTCRSSLADVGRLHVAQSRARIFPGTLLNSPLPGTNG